ncbi:hypothetical protein HPP92_003436 [Vanilla planifolia]|uniref:GAGA-binding transcriptional activator n=1 Tax=Vanilla planifolia TaxID=51239 RepID=A0A835VIY4_VANPL|nr:hypothetical protein HPP92_003436 [Vanilla planifolia]
MDDSGQRENGRYKADHYKSVHAQWMMPQHQVKENNNTMKVMAILAERDNAIQERNIALAEKKAALAERDMAIVQRDAAISERNTAIMERENALAALEYARENSMTESHFTAPRGAKHFHQQQHSEQHLQLPSSQLSDSLYIHERDMCVTEPYPISAALDGAVKSRKTKRTRKETKTQAGDPSKKVSKGSRKVKRVVDKRVTVAKPMNEWKGSFIGGGEDLNKQAIVIKHPHAWKGNDLSLNLVEFDEQTMPPPMCSCTGKLHQCYKWGNGGWQSACCTTMLSMYPLPIIPNKRHARVAGRKMSGGAFIKLLSRLAAEGHDLSAPLDLKDHWAKHGTNRYITIK